MTETTKNKSKLNKNSIIYGVQQIEVEFGQRDEGYRAKDKTFTMYKNNPWGIRPVRFVLVKENKLYRAYPLDNQNEKS